MIIRYREVNGQVVKQIVHRSHIRGEPRPDRHFSETILNALYKLECEQGSRFRSSYSKNILKNVHDTAIQRWEQTGQKV